MCTDPRQFNPTVPATFATTIMSKSNKVHPVAAIFPLASEEEIRDLAQDIKEHGQRLPIVRNQAGITLDGRQREEACKLAGVEPSYAVFTGPEADEIPFIMSVNDKRRHMKLGQRAMIAAKVAHLMGASQRKTAKSVGIAKGYVSNADIVLQYGPDLVDSVIAGTLALNDAYTEAKNRKAIALSEEQKISSLRNEYPDLMALVDDEAMSLNEACAAASERTRKREEDYKSFLDSCLRATQKIGEFVQFFSPRGMTPEQLAADLEAKVKTANTGNGDLSIEALEIASKSFIRFIQERRRNQHA